MGAWQSYTLPLPAWCAPVGSPARDPTLLRPALPHLMLCITRRLRPFCQVTSFTGQDKYTPGDIARAAGRQLGKSVAAFTGKGTYQFGDVTKQAISKLTDKEDYEFGDLTKSLVGKLFGKDKGKDKE